MSRREKVIVTHTDLDGIASAALIARGIGGYDRLYFAQPHQLYAVLCKVPNSCELYVADLGINPKTLDRVVKELSRIVRSGGKVRWFDHHVWDEEWIEAIKSIGVDLVVDRSTCATGVVQKYLPVSGEGVDELVKAACSLDLWRFDHWLGNYLGRVVGYKGGAKWKEYVVNVLTNFRGELPKEFLEIVEEVVSRELKTLSKALREARTTNVGNLKIVYYFKGDEEHITSYIANLLMSRYGADIAVICRRGSVSLRSRHVDVRELAKALGGGGHPRASGAPLRTPLIARLLLLIGIKSLHLKYCIKEVISKAKEVYLNKVS